MGAAISPLALANLFKPSIASEEIFAS
jgi:DNA-binding transcriptional LysR family regulator